MREYFSYYSLLRYQNNVWLSMNILMIIHRYSAEGKYDDGMVN